MHMFVEHHVHCWPVSIVRQWLSCENGDRHRDIAERQTFIAVEYSFSAKGDVVDACIHETFTLVVCASLDNVTRSVHIDVFHHVAISRALLLTRHSVTNWLTNVEVNLKRISKEIYSKLRLSCSEKI